MTKIEKAQNLISADNFNSHKELALFLQTSVAEFLSSKGRNTSKGTLMKYRDILNIEADKPAIDGSVFQMSIGLSIEPVTLNPTITIGGFRPEQLRTKKKFANVTYNRVEDVLDIISSRKFQSDMSEGKRYSTDSGYEKTKHYNYVNWTYNIPFAMQDKPLEYRLNKLIVLMDRFLNTLESHGLGWIKEEVDRQTQEYLMADLA